MKIKVLSFDSQNVFGSMKQAVFNSCLAYAKTYELLHKQIWRKAPHRIQTYTNPYYTHHLGRPVVFVRLWNINSRDRSPYSYSGGDGTFGLNQLFGGQDYRKEFVGKFKYSIAQDECWIQPKEIRLDGGTIWYWIYYRYDAGYNAEGDYSEKTQDGSIYYAENVDKEGNVLVKSVRLEYYNVESVRHRRVVQTNGDDSVTVIELGAEPIRDGAYGYDGEGIEMVESSRYFIKMPDFSEHGEVLHTTVIDTSVYIFTDASIWGNGWIKCFQDGTVIEFTPALGYANPGDEGSGPSDWVYGTYKVLPMLLTDSGDLAMDSTEFVDRWNDYFELWVYREESSSFFGHFIKLVSIIVAAIITYLSWGTLSGVAKAIVAAAFVAFTVGTLTGNSQLALIGSIVMAVMTIGTSLASSAGSSATSSVQLSTVLTAEAFGATSQVGTTFAGYSSAAGFGNFASMPLLESYTAMTVQGMGTEAIIAGVGSGALSAGTTLTSTGMSIGEMFSMGRQLYGVYNDVNSLFNPISSSSSTSSSSTSESSNLKISIAREDESADDVLGYINKVINIV